MECTKVNCPMQAGTKTDNCGVNCPWRTTAKRGDLISRVYVLAEYDRQHKGPPGGARKIMKEAPAVDAVPVEWLKEHDDEDIRDSDGNSYGRRGITVLEALSIWQREQEAQDGRRTEG